MTPPFIDVLTEVAAKRDEIGASKSGAYYRGHTHSAYELIPTLLRKCLKGETEHNLYHECYARIPNQMSTVKSSWESLATLQHYGVPTRLLDWTESFATALYFSLQEESASPCIFLINAFRHNRSVKASKKPRILLPGLDEFPDYLEHFVDFESRKEWPYRRPVFIQLPWTSERIKAQNGFFTVHGDEVPLEESSKKYIRKIMIPDEALEGAWKFLEMSGTSDESMFPDMVGFSNFIRKRYSI